MLMKQGTDKYNIYFAYKRSKINKERANFLFQRIVEYKRQKILNNFKFLYLVIRTLNMQD